MNLRKNRRDSGLTQYQLARITRIHRWRISHAELGLLTLTVTETNAVRDALLEASRKKSASVESELKGTRSLKTSGRR